MAVLFPMFEEGAYKVSVLIPVYGVEQYIERCARSLFEQTYSNLEFVFVNDCTHDRSMDILQQVLEDYPKRKASVKIVNHEKNRGLAAARNTALDNATGEFVSHVDSDDWLEVNAIASLVKRQQETNADIVSGNMYVHTINGMEKYHEPLYESKDQRILRQLPPSCDHNVIRRIIRRSLYENNRIRCIDGCNMGEDLYTMVQLCWYADAIATIDGFVYHYDLNRPDSYTRESNDEKRLNNHMQLVRNWAGVVEFLSDKGEAFYRSAVSNMADCVKEAMRLALKFKSKACFEELAALIYGNKALMEIIGWRNTGFRSFSQSYPMMWMKNSANRAAGYVRYKFKGKQ